MSKLSPPCPSCSASSACSGLRAWVGESALRQSSHDDSTPPESKCKGKLCLELVVKRSPIKRLHSKPEHARRPWYSRGNPCQKLVILVNAKSKSKLAKKSHGPCSPVQVAFVYQLAFLSECKTCSISRTHACTLSSSIPSYPFSQKGSRALPSSAGDRPPAEGRATRRSRGCCAG